MMISPSLRSVSASGIATLLLAFLVLVYYLHFKASMSTTTQLDQGDSEATSSPLTSTNLLVWSTTKKQKEATNDVKEAMVNPRSVTLTGCTNNSKSYPPAKCNLYWYVKFWRAGPQEWDCFLSPLSPLFGGASAPTSRPPLLKEEDLKYVVFEPDRGGWNNIRMAAEISIMFAIITGRTLVLPPTYQMYLLNMNHKLYQKRDADLSNFYTYFDIQKLSEHVNIIPMHEFINKVARKGLLNHVPVPSSSTEFGRKDTRDLWEYLEQTCYVREWNPAKFFIGFNLSKAGYSKELLSYKRQTDKRQHGNNNNNNNNNNLTVFGEIPSSNRLMRFARSGNRKMIPYDQSMHEHKAIYFPGDYRDNYRILAHFYTYLYFADPHMDRIYKRFVRDRLHYKDEIFCLAGRIIEMIHEDAEKALPELKKPSIKSAHPLTNGGNTNSGATFVAFHIRRGDFQYQDVRLPSELIYSNTLHILPPPNVTRILYISTDDKNSSSFDLWRRHFQVRFLSDYLDRALAEPAVGLPGLSGSSRHISKSQFNANWVGMLEQIICANAHTFIGTPYSTFTGYITRMRGYYRDGRYKRSYYFTKHWMNMLHNGANSDEIEGPFWAREFSVAHRDIDDDPRSSSLAS